MKAIADFELTGLPATVNSIGRKHWAVKYNEAQRWKNRVVQQCAYLQICGLNLSRAVLELTRFSSHECDFDNLAGSFKHVVDGLKAAGVIVDDKPSIIGSPTFIWQKAKQREGKIRIRIWEPQDPCGRSGSTGKA